MRIKKGDNVLVISGKDKGKVGKVLSVLPKKDKIVVENVNKLSKHAKSKRQDKKGQKIQVDMPIDISNVLFKCPKCNKAVRTGIKIGENKKKFRICKKCKETI
ncbi:MAG: 50S ribosomal protein L24 [Patescibacteria group bacterium]|nr:50S ribosomal protein L24 [Patescibacteria group bacterium]